MSDTEPRSFLSEGVVIFALTLIAYYGAYWFEVGYALHFGIPRNMISVGADNLIFFVQAIVGAAAFFFMMGESLSAFYITDPRRDWSRHESRSLPGALWVLFARNYALIIAIFLVIGIIPYVGEGRWPEVTALPLLAILWYAFDAVFSAVRVGGPSIRERLDLRIRDGLPKIPLLDLKSGRNWRQVKLLLLTWLVMVLACKALGLRVARLTHEFLFTETQNAEVVLRRYGDQFVLAPYNSHTNSIDGRFRLAEMTVLDGLQMRRVDPIKTKKP